MTQSVAPGHVPTVLIPARDLRPGMTLVGFAGRALEHREVRLVDVYDERRMYVEFANPQPGEAVRDWSPNPDHWVAVLAESYEF